LLNELSSWVGSKNLSRQILASRLQKAASKPPENNSQFAVWSLNRVKILKYFLIIKIKIEYLKIFYF